MATAVEVARLSDLLPAEDEVTGLARIPERYRLQFVLLAADRLRGRPGAEVTALADRLADLVEIPPDLLAEFDADTRALDGWFRAALPQFRDLLGELVS